MTGTAIDAVYTWVDGSDPNWLADKRSALDALGDGISVYFPNGLSDARFHSRDELKYSLRSLERHAPFIRRVHLITAGQIPAWLKTDHPDLQIVFHKDLFPDSSHLPTFNSCAIETHLHQVPQLSERFIYLNDDVFLLRPASPETFFDAQGRAVVYHGTSVRWDKDHPGYHQHISRKARNNSQLLEETFGFRIERKLAHTSHSLQRSIFEELWQRYPEPLNATSSHAFRHPDDLSPAASLAAHYALCTDRARSVAGPPHVSFFKVKDRVQIPIFLCAKFLTHWLLPGLRRDFMAINDGATLIQSRIVDWAIPAFLRRMYPEKSRFEM